MASSFVVHLALACGYMSFVFPGFARADVLEDLRKVQTAMLTQQLDTDIFRTRVDQCRATNFDSKLLYGQRLSDKLQQWRALKSYQYRLPDCAEFGQPVAGVSPGTVGPGN